MKKLLYPITFFLFFLLLTSFVYAGTLTVPQRQGQDTPDQVFSQSIFDYTDYSSYDSLSNYGGVLYPVCSDDIYLEDGEPQEMAICMNFDESDTLFAYTMDSDTHELTVLTNNLSGINWLGIPIENSSGVIGIQSQVMIDIDGDGYDEWIAITYNTTSSQTQLAVYEPNTVNNPTEWQVDEFDDLEASYNSNDHRERGSELACGENSTEWSCFALYNEDTGGANEGWEIAYFDYDNSGEFINNKDGSDVGTSNCFLALRPNNPAYLTAFDIDNDDTVEAVFIEQCTTTFNIYSYEPDGTITELAGDIDQFVDITIDGRNTIQNRAYMNIQEWDSGSAGEEILISGISKVGSDYYFYFIALSNTGSHLGNYTEEFDSTILVSQPFMCLHDNEYACVRVNTPVGTHIFSFSPNDIPFSEASAPDSECSMIANEPYVIVLESETDTAYTDDFYTVQNNAVCSAYTGQYLIGGCAITGLEKTALIDIDNDGSRDILYQNREDSCMVLSGIGLGINYQPWVSNFNYDTGFPICENETINISFSWNDQENDYSQFRYQCPDNSTWLDWSTLSNNEDTRYWFECSLINKSAMSYFNLTEEEACDVWGSSKLGWLLDWFAIIDCDDNTTILHYWQDNANIEIRDNATHIVYINPNTKFGTVTWTNSTICYNQGEESQSAESVCGNGVCESGETTANCPEDCEVTVSTLVTGADEDNAITNAFSDIDNWTGLGYTILWLLVMAFIGGVIWTNAPEGYDSAMIMGVISIIEIILLIVGTLLGFIPTIVIISIVVIAILFIAIFVRRMFTGGG